MKLAMRARSAYKKITLISAAFILAVSSLTASVPFILSQRVGAIAGYNYSDVTLNSGEWTVDRQAPSGGWSTDPGNGRVIVNINQLHSSATPFNKTEGVSAPVASGTTALTGSFYIPSDWATKDTLRVGLWGVTDTPASWPIVEYVANTDGYTGWRYWDTVNGGWTNVPAALANINGRNSIEIIVNPVKNTFTFYVNSSKIGELGAGGAQSFVRTILNHYNKGTGNSAHNYSVDWRNLRAGTAPVTTACSTPTIQWSRTLDGWNPTSTGTAGHSVVTGNGIRVYTDDNTSQAKATGYKDVNYPLSANGSQTIAESISWVQEYGAFTPGLQLIVDFDNDGTSDGILVGEAVYGNNWWLSSGSAAPFVKDNAPRTGTGQGSNWFGTINDWLTVFPNAQVKQIGYSLGSGVYAGGVLQSMTFGCVTYKFDNEGPTVAPQPYNPSNGGWSTNATPTFVWRNNVTDADRYEVRLSMSPARTPNVNDGELSGADAVNTFAVRASGDYSIYTPGANLSDGTWFWQVRAVDTAGNPGKWSNIWSIKVDTTPPAAPSLVTPDWYVANGATKTLDWNAPADTDVAYYEYAEYNNTAPTANDTPWSWKKNISAPTTETTDTAWGSDVKIFWRVRAVDTAGNVGSWSETRTIVTDRTNPTSSNNLGELLSGTAFITQQINDNFAAKSGKLRIWKLVEGVSDNSKFYASPETAVDGNGKIEYELDTITQLYGDGTYLAKFTATDRAGNAIVTEKRFDVDNTRPSTPSAPTTLRNPTNDTSVSWGWGASTDGQSGLAGYEYAFVPIGVTPSNWVSTSSNTVTIPGLVNGKYQLYVRSLDNAGNRSEEVFGEVEVDTIAPTVLVNTMSSAVVGSLVSLSGTLGGYDNFTVTIGDINYTPQVVVDDINNTWSLALNTTNFAASDYVVRVFASDAAGNSSFDQKVLVLTAPVVQGTSGQTNGTPQLQTFNGPAAINPGAFQQVLGDATIPPADDQSAQTGAPQVEGVSTVAQAANSDANQGRFMGLAWYWWLLILAGVAAIIWGIYAAVRGRSTES